jgi:phage baseplate assembly protein W
MTTRAEKDAALALRRALGRGIRLEPVAPGLDVSLDLAFVTRNSRRDLDLVEAADCLAQDLRVALTTALGSDPFDRDFGFDGIAALAQETDPILLQERLRIAVVRVLAREPRITAIRAVELERARGPGAPTGQMNITATVQAVGGTALTVSIQRPEAP